MKQKIFAVAVWFLSTFFSTGCTSDKQSTDSLPFIDVRRNYPEKEIILTDIANVTYLHLNTQNDDYLYRGGINYHTENTLVVGERSSNSVLFFSKDGNPISRFNRYGQGPEEYSQSDFTNIIYDETTDEVFVPIYMRNFIQVYSSSGKYKRTIITLQHRVGNIMVPFNDQSFLVYDDTKVWDKVNRKFSGDDSAFTSQSTDSSFVLISRMDGKVLEYVEVPGPATDISDRTTTGARVPTMNSGYAHITTVTNGFLLFHPENDTVYLFKKDKTLTPILRKIPLMSESEMLALNGCFDAGRYQFMSVSHILNVEVRKQLVKKYYMRDKETGEVFQPKITLPDYKGKEFFIHAYSTFTRYFENEYQFTLSLSELKQAEKENRLSGELKELVATLNEMADNDIFMFVKFK